MTLSPNIYKDLDDLQRQIERIQNVLLNPAGVVIPQVPVVTALPPTPAEGDIIDYELTGGDLWRFRFNAGAWRFIGGPPLIDYDAAEVTATTNPAGGVALGGPSIVVPLSGVYEVDTLVSRVRHGGGSTSTYYSVLRVVVNGVFDEAWGYSYIAFPVGRYHVQSTGPAEVPAQAGQTIELRYGANSWNSYWSYRRLRIRPIRLT